MAVERSEIDDLLVRVVRKVALRQSCFPWLGFFSSPLFSRDSLSVDFLIELFLFGRIQRQLSLLRQFFFPKWKIKNRLWRLRLQSDFGNAVWSKNFMFFILIVLSRIEDTKKRCFLPQTRGANSLRDFLHAIKFFCPILETAFPIFETAFPIGNVAATQPKNMFYKYPIDFKSTLYL